MSRIKKTNAVRILEQKNIKYTMLTYESKDGKIDGIAVAQKIGKNPNQVYKTLVTRGISQTIYVFVIPVNKELDLKKAAHAAKEKKVEMIGVKELLPLTGYIRGGCSPIGMKKLYPTFIEQKSKSIDNMIVSGGKIGIQIQIAPELLRDIAKAEFTDLTK